MQVVLGREERTQQLGEAEGNVPSKNQLLSCWLQQRHRGWRSGQNLHCCEQVWALLPGETARVGTWERLEYLVLLKSCVPGTAGVSPCPYAANGVNVAQTPKGSCSGPSITSWQSPTSHPSCTKTLLGSRWQVRPPRHPQGTGTRGERAGMCPVTHNHVLQRVLGEPAVEKHRDEQIPQRRPEYLQKQEIFIEKAVFSIRESYKQPMRALSRRVHLQTKHRPLQMLPPNTAPISQLQWSS